MMARFTRHACNRLRLYRLSSETATLVAEHPDSVTPSYYGRTNAWKRLEGGLLCVTYIDEGDERVIITLTHRRRGPGETGS